ncbi:MAG: Holliday junction branch migration protein RuvA, partial [Bacteroidales bacterium]|nr:Holliday junction branch migration protein RuvA [Bacteroidales bacterium]
MYEYISGILSELTPSYAVVENAGGIGWLINISL